MNFTPVEARVLGSLMEKAITTPDYYPLSLNALVNACNQKNNREPVMELSEDDVRSALSSLQDSGNFAGPARGADSRVTKYEHRIAERFNLGRREEAILCVLLLRGPQTPGELRGRTERMFQFGDLTEVQSTLQKLMEFDPPLARVLPRQPGTKEVRYMHLLSGDEGIPDASAPAESARGVVMGSDLRIAQLENEVQQMRGEIAELKEQFAVFKKQFE